jgi:uncharacterized protein
MAILLDLREMRGSEDRVERTLDFGDLATESGDDYTVAAPIRLSLRLLKDGAKYRLVGKVTTTLRQQCCRCLEAFDVATDLPIDLMYLPHSENSGEGETELSDEDLSTAFYRDEQIDLEHMVREQFQLSLPMKPLCRDDCDGLCPVCGNNRNRERCSCDTSWRDPRLAALETLLSDGRKG